MMSSVVEDLEKVKEALEASLRHVPRHLEKREGFFTRFLPNPDHATASEAFAMMPGLIEQAEQTGWQPISLAPRDGTEILAYWDQSRCHGIVGWFGCWMSSDDLPVSAPTHWMPLPAGPLPKVAAKSEAA